MRQPIRSILIALLAVQLAGCTSWQVTGQPLKELEGKQVRLRLDDGRRLQGRLVPADSLGMPVLQPQALDSARIQIDTALVATVQQRKFSAGRTMALVIPVVAVMTLIAISAWVNFEFFPEDWSSESR